jgi:hypothetical protein
MKFIGSFLFRYRDYRRTSAVNRPVEGSPDTAGWPVLEGKVHERHNCFLRPEITDFTGRLLTSKFYKCHWDLNINIIIIKGT